jgi:anthranilate synthase component 2
MIEVFGGKVTYAKKIMHGKSSKVTIDTTDPIFTGLDEQVTVARYHSLAGDENNWPESLKIIGKSDDGEIMAIHHKDYPVYGLQFHPESILTPEGTKIMQNLLKEITK